MDPAPVELLPHLTRSGPRRTPAALVLMLHGLVRSPDPLDSRSPSWLRLRLMQAQLQGVLGREGTALWLLRYRFGGWADGRGVPGGVGHPAPVADARWALDQVRDELGDLPVVLLGHSMGARTAVSVADEPAVRGVVALAPWFNPGDPVATLRGRHLRAAHGRADRVTSFAATQHYVRRAAAVALSSELVDMGARGHTMLPQTSAWNRVALAGVRDVLGFVR